MLSAEENIDILHERFAQVNEKYLSMVKNNCVTSLENIKLGAQQANIPSIVTRVEPANKLRKFISKGQRAQQVGKRVHVEICRLIDMPNISGKVYFTLFENEFSNYRLVIS